MVVLAEEEEEECGALLSSAEPLNEQREHILKLELCKRSGGFLPFFAGSRSSIYRTHTSAQGCGCGTLVTYSDRASAQIAVVCRSL